MQAAQQVKRIDLAVAGRQRGADHLGPEWRGRDQLFERRAVGHRRRPVAVLPAYRLIMPAPHLRLARRVFLLAEAEGEAALLAIADVAPRRVSDLLCEFRPLLGAGDAPGGVGRHVVALA